MKKLFIATAVATYVLLFLSGCSSVGVQYKQPSDQENSANLEATNGVFINTFNEKGCYAGRTHIDHPMKIYADQEAFFVFEQAYANKFCRVIFSFVPEKDSTYKFFAGLGGEKCFAQVLKINGEESVPVKITPLRFRTGFACIKFVPRKQHSWP